MEMDEVITQLQQWRNVNPVTEPIIESNIENEYVDDVDGTSLLVNDRFRIAEAVTGPESDESEVNFTKEKKYVADEEMILKVKC